MNLLSNSQVSKFQKNFLGIIITVGFSAMIIGALWIVGSESFTRGYKLPYREACEKSCVMVTGTKMRSLRASKSVGARQGRHPSYTCICEDGRTLTAVPSRMYTDFNSALNDD